MNETEILRDPGFQSWMMYAIAAVILWEKVSGILKARRVRIDGGEVVTTPAVRYADEGDLEKLRDDLDELRQENAAQHQAAALAGQQRVMALSEVVDAETKEIMANIRGLDERIMERLDTGFNALHEKVNGVAILTARHDVALPRLEKQVDDLTRKHSEAMGRLHERVNESIRMAAAASKR